MYCCKICCKEFKTKWQLERHLSKKIPCKESRENLEDAPQNPYLLPQNPYLVPQNPYLAPQNLDEEYCKYCNKYFKRKDNKTRHEQICKDKDDYVRNMELQLNIGIPKDIPKTNCRFCNHVSKSLYNLPKHVKVCKEKEKYKERLEMMIRNKEVQNVQTINNNTINNTINNNTINNNTINLTVNSIGCENMNYINTNMIKKLHRNALSNSEFMAKTLAIIHADENHPENHNIIYNNRRSDMALVKMNDRFEYSNVDVAISKILNNWLDHLIFTERYDDLPNHIKKKYEEIGEDDKLANSIIKTHIYNNSKRVKHKKTLEFSE
uniref:Uncharacterized protein n=1 Tax=viral metagenome TaxID=1070528 RepID=A0A6C0F5W8_9ZZZZ|tara:strand:+ start:57 stop:1022 length:966 start_codon:yes stop_codon:yes gene_type:complete